MACQANCQIEVRCARDRHVETTSRCLLLKGRADGAKLDVGCGEFVVSPSANTKTQTRTRDDLQ